MPVARFQFPDGRIGRFEVPDGTSPEQATALISQQVGGQGAPAGYDPNQSAAQNVANDAITKGAQAVSGASPAELIAGNPVTRFALGAAAPFRALMQARGALTGKLANMLGLYPDFEKDLNNYHSQLNDLVQAGRNAYGSQGADVAGTAGEILNPVGLMAGGAIGPLGGEATTTLAKLGKSAAKGAAIGGVYGVSTPVSEVGPNFWSDKVQQGGVGALTGALLGPAIDVTAMGIKGLYHLIEPWLPGGQESILRRTVGKVLGPKKAEVQAALDAYKSPVPGAPATAAEAGIGANSAELSGLQRLVTGYAPTEYDAIAQAQNAARRNAIGTVEEGNAAIKATQQARQAVAGPLYKAAENQVVAPDPVLQGIFERPSMKKALARAAELSQEQGIPFDSKGPMTVDNLHNIKMALDDLTSNPERFGIGGNEERVIGKTKEAFLKWIDRPENAPLYGQARQAFAQMSQPVNQAQVLTDLSKRLNPALSSFGAEPAQRAASFATAVQEAPQTIKRATGQARFNDLGQILSSEQMQAVQGVGESLAQSARNQQLGRAGQANAARLLRMSFDASKPEAPHVLEHKFVIWNYLINRLSGVSNERTLELLSQRMQDPAAFRKLLGSMPVTQRQRLTEQAYAFLQQQGLTPQTLRTIVTGEGAVPAAKAAGEQ